MDIGVLTVALGDDPFPDVLSFLAELGVESVELGTGGFPGQDHVDRERLLTAEQDRADLRGQLDRLDLSISALATHNNPVHPDEERASRADRELRQTIELANALDVNCVTCFSGLPAGGPNDETPNWITAPWPPAHAEALEYQRDVVVGYWEELAAFADDHGVDLAIEMHPNMFVYEPTGLLELREATNDRIGANLDPSHLFWQGIEIDTAIRELGAADAIHHVHAKDTNLHDPEVRRKGVLDTTPYTDEARRSWLFRTVGYGHGEGFWKDFVSTLRMMGYDGTLSIEHEDSLTTSREGIRKAVDVLDRAILETVGREAHWA